MCSLFYLYILMFKKYIFSCTSKGVNAYCSVMGSHYESVEEMESHDENVIQSTTKGYTVTIHPHI